MQCLYCSKGIGPIRQLRDLEFCSDAHRRQFRERYRQQLYEALAPAPAPVRLGDFMERTAPAAGPAPRAALDGLPKPPADDFRPALQAKAAGVFAERSGWILGPTFSAIPTRLAWQDFTLPSSSPDATPARTASFSISFLPLECVSAGAAPTALVAAKSAARPSAAAPRICKPALSLPATVSLPEAARSNSLLHAQPFSTPLQAAMPASGDPAAIGPVPPAIAPAITLPCGTAVRGPAAPAPQSAMQVSLSHAQIASKPQPLEAGPVPVSGELQPAFDNGIPVAFAPLGTRNSNVGVVLPKPPAEFPLIQAQAPQPADLPSPASRQVPILASGSRRVEQTFSLPEPLPQPDLGPLALAPMAPTADLQPAGVQVASPAWQAARIDVSGNPLGSIGSHACLAVECNAVHIGALAGWVEPPGSLQEAAGNRNPSSAGAAAPAHIETIPVRHELSALPGAGLPETGSATLPRKPATSPTAAPSWGAARLAAQDHPLVPLPDVALPRIDCLPAAAGAIAGPSQALPPEAGRAVRSCAVLWTLRVARMYNPEFRMDPVRAKFNDLVRPERGAFGLDLEDQRPRKSNLRAFPRADAAPARKLKWQFVGAAAAALLLAGVLRPQVAPKGFAGSLPWRGMSIRQWMSQRATRDFADDFRAGLNQWKGVQAKWPKSWSYSTDGFIHPGQLALYRPSVPLSDYRFEFMAQIESKSVDWVVRAHDADNYYALKFTVLEPGPRPIVAMVRYPVIEGSKGARVLTPLRMMIHANTPYRVTVDVKGNRYRAYIEGQEADFWTEDRLKTGGVGFFSETGERARVYWVKLESHGDILGRICGLLSGKGSQNAAEKETQAMDYRNAGTTDVNAASGPGGAEIAVNTAQETRIGRVLSKAASLHLDGKLDDAAQELVRALDGGERHPALYFALGQLQYEMQEYGPASQSYGHAALLQPLHPTAHFNAGVCLGRIERWDAAAASFRKAISNDPARSEAHLALGACLVQVGLHNEALDAYDRFLAHHPDHDEALFGKAVALQKRDRSSEAVELYKRILNRNPHSEEALSNLVSLSLGNQDYEQVRKYAQRLAEAQPKSRIALEGLAGAAFAAGDHKAAADYSRKLAELAPQVFENWFNLGVACHKAGDLPNASEAYARATRVQPDSPQAHLNLGVALQEQGDLKGARAAYQRALEIDPKLPGVHWNLGLVHEQLGDTQAAEKLYAQVPEDSADSDDAAFRIGHLRLERADYPGSIQAFQSCLAKRPNWPEARLNLGIAHWRAGDKDAARTCFQELTASGADSKEALRGLAALSLENKDYDKAFEIYRQLLDSGERSPELLYNAGLICQRRGEVADAAVLYKEALKTDPGFGEALLNLGHALMTLGNEFEARSCWRKAVIAKPELAQRYFEPAALAS